MGERFRITDSTGTDVYLEDGTDSWSGEACVMLTVDGDAQVPDTAWLDVEKVIAIRDALDAFIDGRFDAFLKAIEGGAP